MLAKKKKQKKTTQFESVTKQNKYVKKTKQFTHTHAQKGNQTVTHRSKQTAQRFLKKKKQKPTNNEFCKTNSNNTQRKNEKK